MSVAGARAGDLVNGSVGFAVLFPVTDDQGSTVIRVFPNKV
jgi:hypothetical protein